MFLVFGIAVWSLYFMGQRKTELVVEAPAPGSAEEKTLSVTLFYPNGKTDPGFMDCNVVRGVTRTIPYTTATARAALTELIKGPLPPELNDGFVTSIDSGTTIKSLAIKDGVATVDFSKELGFKNVGLCAGQFIKAQIEQTLLQFPTIKKVQISIEGDKDFVQP